MGRLLAAISIAGLLAVAGCAVKPGDCRVSQTESLNTYTAVGEWKKITGYPQGQVFDDLNYDFLIVEPGNYACKTHVQMGGSVTAASNFKGTYYPSQVTGVNAIRFPAPMNTVTYSFSGSCGETVMALDGPSTKETYKLVRKDVNVGDCPR